MATKIPPTKRPRQPKAPASPARHLPTRRNRKRERTEGHLAATALKLFDAHGFEAVTMEQIAAAADVAKGTLYNHFPVKEALLAYLFRQEIAAGMQHLHGTLQSQKTFVERMRFLLRESARWNESRRAYMPHYLRFRTLDVGVPAGSDRLQRHTSGSQGMLEALFRTGQDSGEVRKDLSPSKLASLFEFMCFGAVVVWLGEPDGDLNERFQFGLEVLLHGAAS